MTDDTELRALTDRLDHLEGRVAELQRVVERRPARDPETARSGENSSEPTGERGWIPVAVAAVDLQIRLLERLEQRLEAFGSGDGVRDSGDGARTADESARYADTALDPEVAELLEALRRLDREIRDELRAPGEVAADRDRASTGGDLPGESGSTSRGGDSARNSDRNVTEDGVHSDVGAGTGDDRENRRARVDVEAELESIRRSVRGDADADVEPGDGRSSDEESGDDG